MPKLPLVLYLNRDALKAFENVLDEIAKDEEIDLGAIVSKSASADEEDKLATELEALRWATMGLEVFTAQRRRGKW